MCAVRAANATSTRRGAHWRRIRTSLQYPDLPVAGVDLEFLQNKAPKVTASNLSPASWPTSPGHEWCPPGHGDVYPAMYGSGTLESLLAKGFKCERAATDVTLVTEVTQRASNVSGQWAGRTVAGGAGWRNGVVIAW